MGKWSGAWCLTTDSLVPQLLQLLGSPRLLLLRLGLGVKLRLPLGVELLQVLGLLLVTSRANRLTLLFGLLQQNLVFLVFSLYGVKQQHSDVIASVFGTSTTTSQTL